MTIREKKNLLNIVNKSVGVGYNFNLIEQAYVPFHSNILMQLIRTFYDVYNNVFYPKKERRLLCSELIGELFKDIGILDHNIHVNYILPEDYLPHTQNNLVTCDSDKEIPLMYELPVQIQQFPKVST